MNPATSQSSLYEVVRGWAASTPDAIALAAPGRRPLTYASFIAQIEQTVGWLRSRGVSAGGRVAIVLPNGPELAAATFATAAGAVAVPLKPDTRRREFAELFGEIAADAVIVPHGEAPDARTAALERGVQILELVPSREGPAGSFTFADAVGKQDGELAFGKPSDVALLLRTSGTTARSRIVPMTHKQLCAASGNTATALGLTPDDCCLNPATLYHGHGLLAGVLAPVLAGGSAFLPPDFDAERFFAWFDEARPTWFTAVPTVHQAILAEAPRHREIIARGRMRLIRSASAYLPDVVRGRLEEVFGVPVTESYGLTEASQVTYTPLDTKVRKVGSLGLAGTSEIGIMDEAGTLLPPGEPGQIVARGPAVMEGYLGFPELNAQVFRNGWFQTGDVGYLDIDGHLYMTGRVKDQINRGGEKIAPQEIDAVLMEHPAVAQAMAFPIAHPTLGEDVAAAVVLVAGSAPTADELRAHIRSRISASKVPHRVFFVPAIPSNATGKLMRRQLAALLHDVTDGSSTESRGPNNEATYVAPESDIERSLAAIWAEVLGVDRVGVEDNFFDLGGDSLLAVRLFAAMARDFPLEPRMTEQNGTDGFAALQPSVLWDAPTVRRLVHRIAGQTFGNLRRPLVEVQRGGDGPPFVMLTGDWMGFYVRKLAQALPREQSVYALTPHDMTGEGALTTIEQMADDYIATLRAAYPRGPYMLGGYSAAGIVALEMARRLEAMNERVSGLFIIDAKLPDPRRRYLRFVVRAAGRVLRWDPSTELDIFATWQSRVVALRRRTRDLVVGQWRRQAAPAAEVETQWLPGLVHRALHRILDRYVPGPFGGEIDLISAERGPIVQLGLVPRWRQVARELRVHSVPGDHSTCLTEHVDIVGQHLRECLSRACEEMKKV